VDTSDHDCWGSDHWGYFDFNFTAHGFLLQAGDFQSIDCPGYTSLFLSGLNPVGEMTGGVTSTDGSQHGAMVRDGVCTQIDFPSGTGTYANALNSQGNVVGRYTGPDRTVHGYLLPHVR
jgi:hypothetical protein